MKKDLKEQLQDVSLDYSEYGNLPRRDDIYYASTHIKSDGGDSLLSQWKRLLLLRKNLGIINNYIQTNRGETLKEWVIANGEGIKPEVLQKLGDFNNSTKGITMYFLNLQKRYDEEEEKYDKMELSKDFPDDIIKDFEPAWKLRKEKRATRRDARKVRLKDFKKDDKGYLVIEMPAEYDGEVTGEPKNNSYRAEGDAKNTGTKELNNLQVQPSSSTPQSEPIDPELASAIKPALPGLPATDSAVIKKKGTPVSVYIAGFFIAVSVVMIYQTIKSGKE